MSIDRQALEQGIMDNTYIPNVDGTTQYGESVRDLYLDPSHTGWPYYIRLEILHDENTQLTDEHISLFHRAIRRATNPRDKAYNPHIFEKQRVGETPEVAVENVLQLLANPQIANIIPMLSLSNRSLEIESTGRKIELLNIPRLKLEISEKNTTNTFPVSIAMQDAMQIAALVRMGKPAIKYEEEILARIKNYGIQYGTIVALMSQVEIQDFRGIIENLDSKNANLPSTESFKELWTFAADMKLIGVSGFVKRSKDAYNQLIDLVESFFLSQDINVGDSFMTLCKKEFEFLETEKKYIVIFDTSLAKQVYHIANLTPELIPSNKFDFKDLFIMDGMFNEIEFKRICSMIYTRVITLYPDYERPLEIGAPYHPNKSLEAIPQDASFESLQNFLTHHNVLGKEG